MKRPIITLTALAALVSTPALFAQSNTIVGHDIELGVLGTIAVRGRQGTYPAGVNALAMSTTACNVGMNDVDWFAPMNIAHPTISFIIAREMNGRLEQISDRSFVKHGFFATNQSTCTPCVGAPGSTQLGVGCSDTYSTVTNSDQYYLGAPDEIDPWLGKWSSQCSHFDRGEPAVSPPANCDNVRSLTQGQANALGPVGHRINVLDSDLDQAATFFYQANYTVFGEAESNRYNNIVSRPFVPTWTGSDWSVQPSGPQQNGSVLQRWSGAIVSSNTNGTSDGRVYVAVKVTGPVNCVYHYEFAVHNRDNARGVTGFRIPLAAGAQVMNEGFRDIDLDAGNDWSFAISGGEIRFTAAAQALEWNTIFNFWFDSDAAPQTSVNVSLDQGPGSGFTVVPVASTAPTGFPCLTPSVYCTAKVNSQGCTPAVAFAGTPSATNPSAFDITAQLVLNDKMGLLFYGLDPNAAPFQGGTQCVLPPLHRTPLQSSGGNPPPDDCSGQYALDFNLRIQSGIDAALVAGQDVYTQFWSRDGHDLAGFGTNLTDALAFTIQP